MSQNELIETNHGRTFRKLATFATVSRCQPATNGKKVPLILNPHGYWTVEGLDSALRRISKEISMMQKTVVRNNGNFAYKSNLVKVASTSRSTAVAGAIAGTMRIQRSAEVQAIGAGAINQAVKAMAIARLYLKDDGIDFGCIIEFIEIEIDSQERTALHFSLEACPPRDYL